MQEEEDQQRKHDMRRKMLQEAARLIKSDKCQRISFLTGAGVSVAAGIPDFRSPGGMYDTLRPELLTATPTERAMMEDEPTFVVSWDCFEDNQFPYLELRRPFILGINERKWKPTLAHYFIKLVHDEGKLQRLYTQNIDGLDFLTGIPDEHIVTVHGNLAQVECEFCHKSYPADKFREAVKKNIKDIYGVDKSAPSESAPILCPSCGNAGVKPRTVLYGRALPPEFNTSMDKDFRGRGHAPTADLLITTGTSLTVSPANYLPRIASCAQLIVNDTPVDAQVPATRLFAQGKCDEVFLELAELLGWAPKLAAYASDMAPSGRKLLIRKGYLKNE